MPVLPATRLSSLSTAPVRLAIRMQSAAGGGGDEGMSTAEYAVGTVAACGFGGVLYRTCSGE